MGAFTDLFNHLDADDRVKGKQFEHICKWFLTNDPVYKHELRRVWLWDEWPGRWGGDAGVDLVAEDRQGHLWAIQAKAYSPAYRVTKRDVNKFLAESGRAVFGYRMLIATTNLIDRIGERTVQDQEKRVTFFRLNDLEAANVDWPRSPQDLRPVRRRKRARPRAYQREAITKVLKGFESAERGQLIMACGTGKTLTALFVNEECGAARTLVLVPSLSLLKQTLNVWRANCTIDFASLPVCSDDTVAKSEDDIAVAHTSDIGVPVTTDPDEIAAFLRYRSGPRVVFATYQSSPRIADAFALGKVPTFDLVIADEAHRCAGRVSTGFGTILDPKKIKAKRRLFMTATPRYFTGRVLKAAAAAEFEYASMDDEAKFGKVFHRLGFGEAIKRDLLTDYRVAIVGVDNATYLQWARNRVLVTRDGVEVTDAGTLAGQLGLAKAMRKYDLKRVISFHSRVKRAREFAGSMPEVLAWMPAKWRPEGKLWSRYASGEMPAGDRYVLLQHLGRLDDGDRGLLANARCLAEGVDVPTLDGVAFIDPRRSEVDIVQAVGRAIRKSDDKTVGTIVIPVFVDTDADPEAAVDSSVFKPVWDVLKAIRAHDEELGEQLDEIRRELGRRGALARRPSKIRLDVPAKVSADFIRAFDVRLVEQTTASWEFWFGLLERYVESQGNARVPQLHVVNDRKLGLWVSNQRARYDRGEMDPNYVRRLEELPGWTWDPHVDRWEESFSKLVASVEHYGSACLGNLSLLQDDQLTGWVVRQRAVRNEGRLDTERERRLQALPGWTWDKHSTQWEEGFSRLLEYVRQHGSARNIALTATIGGFKLGHWVNAQRANRIKGKLEANRERRLQKVPGWTWNTIESQWDEALTYLGAYIKKYGSARVPQSYATEDGFRLGQWAQNRRRQYARGALEADRTQQLESLPGWTWDPHADQWEEFFSQLLKNVEKTGTARVAKPKRGATALALWAQRQRSSRAKGELDPERERRLQALPGWTWHVSADQWEEGFAHLQKYVEQKGDARIPQSSSVDGYALGRWVTKQRVKRRQGALESDRVKRLERLPGWSWDPVAELWEEGYRRLTEYVQRNGHSHVPNAYTVDGYDLGNWVNIQRGLHLRKGKLDPARARRLEELPRWTWDARAELWEEGYRRLREYVAWKGDACVPASYTVDGYGLGTWVNSQRGRYAKGILDADRQRRLEALPGWRWNALAAQWEEGFRRLQSFVEDTGHARVPQSYTHKGYRLGSWVAKQRAKHAKGGLEADRADRLEELPGWIWKPSSA